MLNAFLVSVIIPCYNSENFLMKTVKSILEQSYNLIEIILVDDNSSDNTYKIMEDFYLNNSNIKIYKTNENSGPAYARNFGVEKSSGSYLLFVDSDDVIDKHLIEKQLNRLNEFNKEKNEWVMVFSAYEETDKDGKTIDIINHGIQVSSEEILGYLFVRNLISTSGVLVKKDVFLQTGGFDKNLQYSEDWDLWLKIASYGGLIYIEEPLVKVRRYVGSVSSILKNMLDGEKHILLKYDLQFICQSIMKRNLSKAENICDFASILIKLDLWDEVYRCLQDYNNENHYKIYFIEGLYYLHKEDYYNAKMNLIKSLELNSNNCAALNNLACIFAINAEYETAEKYLERCLNLQPNYMDANYNFKSLSNGNINKNNIKITWRELRHKLTVYYN